jgi:hypothetical protein
MYIQWDRTKRLRGKFGPEYDRVVHDHGNARKAEDELLNRQKRIEKFHIRDLNQPEVERFSESWRIVQTQFVDAPREAVAQADRLIRDVSWVTSRLLLSLILFNRASKWKDSTSGATWFNVAQFFSSHGRQILGSSASKTSLRQRRALVHLHR